MNSAEFALLALAFLVVGGALWLEYLDHKKEMRERDEDGKPE